ncbi:hypothetical protein B0J17DRAFT_717565 [Rhizoctonia solani]|nr:hypothetical protein B0J17DRAFT_717565 [Rhizoctonia solani]
MVPASLHEPSAIDQERAYPGNNRGRVFVVGGLGDNVNLSENMSLVHILDTNLLSYPVDTEEVIPSFTPCIDDSGPTTFIDIPEEDPIDTMWSDSHQEESDAKLDQDVATLTTPDTITGQCQLPRYYDPWLAMVARIFPRNLSSPMSHHTLLQVEDILIAKDHTPKITDFGNAVLSEHTLEFSCSTTTQNMTVRWTTPEILNGETKTTQAGDIFALWNAAGPTIHRNDLKRERLKAWCVNILRPRLLLDDYLQMEGITPEGLLANRN